MLLSERVLKAGIKSEHQDKRNEQAQDTKMGEQRRTGRSLAEGQKMHPGT